MSARSSIANRLDWERNQQSNNAVKEALSLLPKKKRQAYEEACEKCPELVELETPFSKFLRYTDNDAWAAAKRLAQYWEDRCDLFGQRAFLPMSQTGEGALTQDDLVDLYAGFFVLVPSSDTGKDVMFIDRTKRLQNASRESSWRSIFYLFQILSEKEDAPTAGILVFVLMIQPRVVDFDRILVQRCLRMIKESFPVKVELNILNCLPKTGKRDLIRTILGNLVSIMKDTLKDGFEVHVESKPGQLLSLMMARGLSVEGIPTSVEGSWKYEEFSRWCRQRATAERSKYRAFSTDAQISVEEDTTTDPQVPPTSMADKNERKRLVNVIHSRQKRERRKAEQKLLEEEANVLDSKKRRLAAEQDRLEQLLTRARAIEIALESNAQNPLAQAHAPALSLPTAQFLPHMQALPPVPPLHTVQQLRSLQSLPSIPTVQTLPPVQTLPLVREGNSVPEDTKYEAISALLNQQPAQQRNAVLDQLLRSKKSAPSLNQGAPVGATQNSFNAHQQVQPQRQNLQQANPLLDSTSQETLKVLLATVQTQQTPATQLQQPQVTQLQQSQATQLLQPQVAQLQQPQATQLQQPQATQLQQPQATQLLQSQVAQLLQTPASQLQQPQVATLLQPQVTELQQPQATQLQQPQVAQLLQPQVAQLLQTPAAQLQQPQAAQLLQTQVAQLLQTPAAQLLQPQATQLQQPQATQLQQPQATQLLQTQVAQLLHTPAAQLQQPQATQSHQTQPRQTQPRQNLNVSKSNIIRALLLNQQNSAREQQQQQQQHTAQQQPQQNELQRLLFQQQQQPPPLQATTISPAMAPLPSHQQQAQPGQGQQPQPQPRRTLEQILALLRR